MLNSSAGHRNPIWFWVTWQRVLSAVVEGLGRKEKQILPTAHSKAYRHCMEIINNKNLLPQAFA